MAPSPAGTAPAFSSADSALLRLAIALRETGYQFATVSPATHARVNDRPENRWARDVRGVFGWSRPFHADILPAGIIGLMQQAGVIEPYAGGWRSTVRLSTLSEQLFLHSAYPTEQPDAVFFGPDTYRFDAAIATHLDGRARSVHRAVDIGCGAGSGAMRIAAAYPEAQVLAVDINTQALRFTRINAALADLPGVCGRHSNLLNDVNGRFDLIVANPPYLVDPDKRAYRHGGGPLGAGLSLDIVDAALERIAPGGTLLLYTGVAMPDEHDPFLAAVTSRLAATNITWTYREMDPDIFGEELLGSPYLNAERIAAVVLTATCSS